MRMSNDDEISEIVDEIVDEMNPVRVEREAERLGITVDDLLARIVTEMNARLA
jgi:hypothetical protein